MPARNRKTPGRPAKRGPDKLKLLLDTLYEEKRPILALKDAELIERRMTDGADGEARRIAIFSLTRPWPEVTEKIRADRETAVAMAAGLACIEAGAARHKKMHDIMKTAQVRLLAALGVRPDAREVIAQGKRDCIEVSDGVV